MCDIIGNSPGQRAMKIMESIHNDIVFKKPIGGAKKWRRKRILEEEPYVEEIGKIIQRDFFPDLEKLKAQNEYLDALDRNDTMKLKELYMKYSGNKPPTERIPSPATFETPANIHNSQHSNKPAEAEIDADPKDEKSKEKKLNLDQYLNSHTSQDNESFEELLMEAKNKHIQKYSYFYNEENKSIEDQKKLLILPSIEQQALPTEKKFCLDTWGYKNRNYIMFNLDGVVLTEAEEMELNKKRQEIVHSNTRLIVNPFNEVQSKETINELAKSQAKVLDGKIGVDGKELLKLDTPQVGGFSFVRTPSPSPSLLGSPLMTWGQIEGTPFRLDGGDTPLPRSQGPSFKMSEPPRREQLAFALAEKVGEKNRDQKKRNIDAQRRQLVSPSPRPNTSAIDRLATMSPAARKLATSRLKLSVNSDLRSTYSPSPLSTQKTPIMKTPRRVSTPLVNIKHKKPTEVSTDDLLKIELPKRKKASDFFRMAAQLQRKWKSLRDSYNRERNKLKNIKSGSGASGRKEYIYFKQLSFLSVLAETRPESRDGEQEPENMSSSVEPRTPVDRKGNTKKFKPMSSVDKAEIELLNNISKKMEDQHDNDSDRSFLLSLLSDFKGIKEDFKLDLKMEMLSLIKKYKNLVIPQPHLIQPHHIQNQSQYTENQSQYGSYTQVGQRVYTNMEPLRDYNRNFTAPSSSRDYSTSSLDTIPALSPALSASYHSLSESEIIEDMFDDN